jgi:hypothetical protein
MTTETMNKLQSAIETSGIKNYQFNVDLGTVLANNGVAFVKDAGGAIACFRRAEYGGATSPFNGIDVAVADYVDIHEFRTGGSFKAMKDFGEALSLSFTNEELQKMLSFTVDNYKVIPETGDYNRFVPLSDKAYEALTPEEKEDYDRKKEAAEEAAKKHLTPGFVAHIDLG